MSFLRKHHEGLGCNDALEWLEKPTQQPTLNHSTSLFVSIGLKQWLAVFPLTLLELCFEQLTQRMNQFVCPLIHRFNLQQLSNVNYIVEK
jgi:hypothetical protein